MLRRVLFWVHLATGLVIGSIVLIMSITGVALTYQKQMTEWADCAYWPGDTEVGLEPLPVRELIARVNEDYPGASPSAIRFYSEPEAPASVSISGGSVFVNRYTGETNHRRAESIRRFFTVMRDWHRWLADDTRSWGRAITGAANLAFLFIVCSGLYLWLPRRWNRSSLRAVTWFKSGLRAKARDFNWHNVFGFWSAIPLMLIVASGAVISYPWASNLVYVLSGTDAPIRGQRGGDAGSPYAESPDLDLVEVDALLSRAESHVPAWRTINVTLPLHGDEAVTFAIDNSFGGQPQSRTTLILDQSSGHIVRRSIFADQTTGQRARSWLRFVHTGEYYGFVGQTVAGIASLAGVFLVYTGFSLALRRLAAWTRRRTRPISATPHRAVGEGQGQ